MPVTAIQLWAIASRFKRYVRRSASQTVATFLQDSEMRESRALRRLHTQYIAFQGQKTES